MIKWCMTWQFNACPCDLRLIGPVWWGPMGRPMRDLLTLHFWPICPILLLWPLPMRRSCVIWWQQQRPMTMVQLPSGFHAARALAATCRKIRHLWKSVRAGSFKRVARLPFCHLAPAWARCVLRRKLWRPKGLSRPSPMPALPSLWIGR